ncbi:MAG: glycine cleavage T C-terminal barrel domain-containing protein [Bryobacterales bacterium]
MRAENRRPEFDVDYFDSNIPHETQQLHLISFTKGCYTGQEIVERVRSQGRVNRLLTPIEADLDTVPAEKDVLLDGRVVGQATSLAVSPRTGKLAGFAVLRREATEPDATISIGGRPARTLDWPKS